MTRTTPPSRRIALAVLGVGAAGAGLALGRITAAGAQPAPAGAQPAPAVRLFKAITARDEVTFGLTAAELDRLGTGLAVERIARKLAADGQITVWQYVVGRAPDGSTRHATTRRVAIMRADTLRIEPYTPALPVAPPPAE